MKELAELTGSFVSDVDLKSKVSCFSPKLGQVVSITSRRLYRRLQVTLELRGVGYAVTEVTPRSVYARDRGGTTIGHTIVQKWMIAEQNKMLSYRRETALQGAL